MNIVLTYTAQKSLQQDCYICNVAAMLQAAFASWKYTLKEKIGCCNKSDG